MVARCPHSNTKTSREHLLQGTFTHTYMIDEVKRYRWKHPWKQQAELSSKQNNSHCKYFSHNPNSSHNDASRDAKPSNKTLTLRESLLKTAAFSQHNVTVFISETLIVTWSASPSLHTCQRVTLLWWAPLLLSPPYGEDEALQYNRWRQHFKLCFWLKDFISECSSVIIPELPPTVLRFGPELLRIMSRY